MRWAWLGAAVFLCACSETDELRIGWVTNEPNPQIGQALAGALHDLDTSVTAYNDKDVLRMALSKRQVDIALLENPERSDPHLRAMAPVFKAVLHVLVQKSNGGCREGPLFDVLASAKVYAGPKGSAAHRLLEILAETGLAPGMADMTLLDTPFGTPPEVFFVFGGVLSHDAVSRLDGFCLRSFDDAHALGAGSAVEALALRYPQLEPFLIPKSLYPTLAQTPVLTVSIQTLLAAHHELDEDLAYQVLERLSEQRPNIRQLYPLADLDTASHDWARQLSLQLHPASLRYLNRDAPGFIERYAEVLAFCVTLAVALVSALVALNGQRRRNRKDRLDAYFVRVMEIRTAVDAGSLSRDVALEQLQVLQSTVVQLLVDERIDADHALAAFLQVSSTIVSEVRAQSA